MACYRVLTIGVLGLDSSPSRAGVEHDRIGNVDGVGHLRRHDSVGIGVSLGWIPDRPFRSPHRVSRCLCGERGRQPGFGLLGGPGTNRTVAYFDPIGHYRRGAVDPNASRPSVTGQHGAQRTVIERRVTVSSDFPWRPVRGSIPYRGCTLGHRTSRLGLLLVRRPLYSWVCDGHDHQDRLSGRHGGGELPEEFC